MLNLRARGRAVLLAGGLFLASLGVLSTGSSPPVQAAPKPAPKVERHPLIHKALRELRAARNTLRKADHDFGGHRVAAVKDIDRAIAELEKALKYDRK